MGQPPPLYHRIAGERAKMGTAKTYLWWMDLLDWESTCGCHRSVSQKNNGRNAGLLIGRFLTLLQSAELTADVLIIIIFNLSSQGWAITPVTGKSGSWSNGQKVQINTFNLFLKRRTYLTLTLMHAYLKKKRKQLCPTTQYQSICCATRIQQVIFETIARFVTG